MILGGRRGACEEAVTVFCLRGEAWGRGEMVQAGSEGEWRHPRGVGG